MALTKVYTKSPCSLDRLIQEINLAPSIIIALDLTTTGLLGSQLTLGFKSDLDDWTEVDAVVAAHDGSPLPQNEVQSVSVQSQPPVVVMQSPAFGSKTFLYNGVTKSLFARFTGKQFLVSTGVNTLTYTATFPWVKMLGVEVINGQIGDFADLKIYDTATGTYSGVPNQLLNQFSYSINIAQNSYNRMAQFDADLYVGMIIKVTYTVGALLTIDRFLGINFLMNEVK